MKVSSVLGGLAGACALALLNQGVKKINGHTPSLDLLGVNVMAKSLKVPSIIPPAVHKLFPVTLGGDLLSNSLYYSMASSTTPTKTLLRGTMLGLGAGLGVIASPQSLGLEKEQINSTVKTKVMTVALYVIGGLVAAAAINLIEKRKG